MHPSSSRAFQKNQDRNLKHPSSMDLISTKQNKETSSGQQTSEWMKERVSKARLFRDLPRMDKKKRRARRERECKISVLSWANSSMYFK